jgi:hypothetical protein
MRLIFSLRICVIKFGFAANTTNQHDQLIYKLYSVGIVWCGATGYIEQGDNGATSQIRRSRVLRLGARSLTRLSFIPPPKPSQRITDGTQTALHTLRMIVGLSKENKGRSSRCRPLQDAIRIMTRKGCKVTRPHCSPKCPASLGSSSASPHSNLDGQAYVRSCVSVVLVWSVAT